MARSGEASSDVGQAGTAGLWVDGHGQKGIGNADRIGPGAGGDPGHVGDGGYVGRELDDERAGGDFVGLANKIFERAGVGAEDHVIGVDVGAGDVQLVGGDAFGLVEPLDDRNVLAHRVTEDVDDDVAARVSAERRQLAGDEVFDAHVLEADGVQHAGGGLDNARRALPAMGSSEIPLVTNPPMRSSATSSSNSMP